jgi:hypothetical protein
VLASNEFRFSLFQIKFGRTGDKRLERADIPQCGMMTPQDSNAARADQRHSNAGIF